MPKNSINSSFTFQIQLTKQNIGSLKGDTHSVYTCSNFRPVNFQFSERVLKGHNYFQLLTCVWAAHSSVEFNTTCVSNVHFTDTLIPMFKYCLKIKISSSINTTDASPVTELSRGSSDELQRKGVIPTGQSPLVWLLKPTFTQLKNTEKWKTELCAFCLGYNYVNHTTFHSKARAAGGSVLLGKRLSPLFTEPSFQLLDTLANPCFPQAGARTGAARQGPAQRAFEERLFPREPQHCRAHLTAHGIDTAQPVATAAGGWPVTLRAPRRKGRAILAAAGCPGARAAHSSHRWGCALRRPSLKSIRQQSAALITNWPKAASSLLTAPKIHSCCHFGAQGRHGSSTYRFISLFCFYITYI